MPTIASLEDLKSAQKEGVSIYAMLYACLPLARRFALCFTEMAQHRMEERMWSLQGKGSRHSKAEWEATSRATTNGFLCRGKLWLQESTPEKLKGEGK